MRLRLRAGERLRLALAVSLTEDGQEDGNWDPNEWRAAAAAAAAAASGAQGQGQGKSSRLDTFEYVMYGKVYHMEGDERDTEGMLYAYAMHSHHIYHF